ncbi:hypothetical protein [Polaribacter sp.]|uniref:hypothetical protein n=1 Tax=Polaribacter sp. TaxID=1920175 RepID=UPI003F6A3921
MFLWLKEGDKGSEIVTLIKPDSEILLKSVSLNILNENAEEFTLLLNIYDIDSITNFPKNQQLERQKVIKSKQTKGWLNINLSEENITIRKPFYIGFQWTDIDKPIPLVGGKIKESNNSLIRYKVLGTWEKYAEWDIKVEAETYK